MVSFGSEARRPVAQLSTLEINIVMACLCSGEFRLDDGETPESVRERLCIELRIRELGL